VLYFGEPSNSDSWRTFAWPSWLQVVVQTLIQLSSLSLTLSTRADHRSVTLLDVNMDIIARKYTLLREDILLFDQSQDDRSSTLDPSCNIAVLCHYCCTFPSTPKLLTLLPASSCTRPYPILTLHPSRAPSTWRFDALEASMIDDGFISRIVPSSR
jgi:hypothetical protein